MRKFNVVVELRHEVTVLIPEGLLDDVHENDVIDVVWDHYTDDWMPYGRGEIDAMDLDVEEDKDE